MPAATNVKSTAVAELPGLSAQAARLIDLGLHELAGLAARDLRELARAVNDATGGPGGSLLTVHPDTVAATALAPLLFHQDKTGFVVADMQDAHRFAPLDTLSVPTSPLYLVSGLDRGDDMANWSPDEVLPQLNARGRTPLLLTEGIHWVLQAPAVLERGHCFMTIGSRLSKPNGTLDARTPAIWISNGTGRDGRERRNAPKIGWCWAGNRHTWLGFASARRRSD
jgi:hypothetical protein